MPSIDMPLEALHRYKPSLYREDDFEPFWQATVAEAMAQPLNAELVPYPLRAKGVTCYAVRFDGFGGGRIAGWYLRPDSTAKVPGLVCYHGYSGRGPRPIDLLSIASQGVAVLSMDCRGQNGQSQDVSTDVEGRVAGWMTKGIRDPRSYYFRYVYADALRALEVLARRDEVDADRLAITGGSQGGAITLATAALTERRLLLAMPDIPFLCDFRRAIEITSNGPYPEIITFLKVFPELRERAIRTLSYVDCMNLAPMIRCRTLIANSLWDDICPPSTVFAAYHHMTCEKEMAIYPYHKHETPYEHAELRFRTLMDVLQP
ncbi:MAG TPA: acetylxylan esterase [Tepidisphaeraceae bacterium]|nr:acetylxylan esterase [Tepidisphaeraceae bacterium]